MKRVVLMILCLLTLNVYSQSLKDKTVLFVYGGWDGHDPKGCRDIFVPWMQEEGAEVVVSDSLAIYKNKELMSRVDLIVQVWTMGRITHDEEVALLEAVRGGAGLAGWHGGLGDSFRNSTEYQFMVGGQWVSHPDNITEYEVDILDKADPVTFGLKQFTMNSEQYYMHVDPGVHVLATTRFKSPKCPWIDGVTMPVAWKKMYGDGRVFYSSLGHVSADFQVPEALEIMKRGILWAVK